MPDVSFGARATRRERDAAPPEHIIGLEAGARWYGGGKPHRTLVGPETFIVQVADDAMAPRVRAGGYIWIDPDEPAVDGRLVAVRDPDRGGETAVRRLVERDGRRTLRALDERDEAPRVDDGVESRRPPVIKSNAGKARAPRMPARRWRKRGGHDQGGDD